MSLRYAAARSLLVFAGASLAGCSGSSGNSEADRPTWTVERTALKVTVREAGSLEALTSETVVSELEGQSAIVEVVPEGTVVTAEDVAAGRILVKLDAKDLNEKLVRQQIDLKEAQAASENARSSLEIQLHQNASDLRQAELDLRFAVLDLRRYVGDGLADPLLSLYASGVSTPRAESPTATVGAEGGPAPADPQAPTALAGRIAAAMASPELAGEAMQRRRELENGIKLAEEELKRAQDKLRWTERLLEQTYVSAEEREADRLAVQRRTVELEQSRTASDQFVRYDFPKEVERLLSAVVATRDDEERTKARALSAQARAEADVQSREEQERLQKSRLADYTSQLDKCVIRATRPGLVVYASSGSDRRWSNDSPIQQGTMVRENQPILTIPNPDSLGAVVNIHESAIEKVDKGQAVTVVVDALSDQPLEGVVERKNRLPNQNDRWFNPDLKLYSTYVRLLGSHPTLQPGMSVRVEIQVADLSSVLAVPLQAVAGAAGRPAVWIVSADGTASERAVVLGLSNDSFVEVKEGLEEGDRVLLAPPRGPRNEEKGPGGRNGAAPGSATPGVVGTPSAGSRPGASPGPGAMPAGGAGGRPERKGRAGGGGPEGSGRGPAPPAMNDVVRIEDVTRHYRMGEDEVRALDGVSIAVREGDYVAIMGPSGSGKSTLLNVLGCLDRPTSGRYLLAGRDVSTLDDAALSRERSRRLGFVFQSYNLIPHLSVLENIQIPMEYAGVPPRESRRRAAALAERMGLETRLRHRPTELSGGQQQRVGIARALANDPVVLLADEPTGNLDSGTGREILALLDELNSQGTTLIVVTHDPSVGERARRIVKMADGRIVQIQDRSP